MGVYHTPTNTSDMKKQKEQEAMTTGIAQYLIELDYRLLLIEWGIIL